MDMGLTDYLPAIEILMCHLGKSFSEACNELGLSQAQQHSLARLQEMAHTRHTE